MSLQENRLPEPSPPETELINAANALPELSAGFRSTTLNTCGVQIRRARRIRIAKAASILIIVASAVFAIGALSMAPEESEWRPMIGDAPQQQTVPRSPGQMTMPPDSSGVAVGNPRPAGNIVEQETNEAVEKFQKRTQAMLNFLNPPGQ